MIRDFSFESSSDGAEARTRGSTYTPAEGAPAIERATGAGRGRRNSISQYVHQNGADFGARASRDSGPRFSVRGSIMSGITIGGLGPKKSAISEPSVRTSQHEKLGSDEMAELWQLTVKTAMVRAKFLQRSLDTSKQLLKRRERGWATKLLTTYGTRYQFALFSIVHLVITLLVWSHFFLKKFRQQEGVPEFIPAKVAVVPEDAGMPMPNYWKKRLIPPLEFGLMHAILWQMVWIPVTMSRHILTLAAQTRIRKFVPFAHMTAFHIALGYIMCLFIVVATIVFFVFFGHGCRQHLGQLGSPFEPVDFCSKFKSEIMITGEIIFLLLVAVMVSSYFRRFMRFEWFYALHHLVFVMFGLAIAHTLDSEFREGTKVGKARSQNFRFVSATLALYMLDRMWSFLNVSRRLAIEKVAVTPDHSMLTLVLYRPPHFRFISGQYAYLQVPQIDMTFHPFSIGSGPQESTLRFYIMVYNGQWTEKLANLLMNENFELGELEVNIMGPFGPGIDTDGFVSVGVVGTGTGIVPMFSLLRDRYACLKLMHAGLVQELNEDPEKVVELDLTPPSELLENMRLLFLQYTWKLHCLEKQGSRGATGMSKRVSRTLLHYVFDVFMHLILIGDMCQGFWTFSWKYLNEMDFVSKYPKIDEEQWKALEVMSLVSILFFGLHCVYKWVNPRIFGKSFMDVLDLVGLGFMIGTHVAWLYEEPSFYVSPSSPAVVLRGTFSLWRILRYYTASERLRSGGEHLRDSKVHSLIKNSRFRLLWVTRGVDAFVHTMKDLEPMVQDLLVSFSPTQVQQLFGLDIYMTSLLQEEQEAVQQLVAGTILEGCVHFGRPDISGWIVERMSEVLRDSLGNCCSFPGGSMLSYCGSLNIGAEVGRGVQEANMQATFMNAQGCHMSFHEEYYGILGGKPRAPPKAESKDTVDRKHVSNSNLLGGTSERLGPRILSSSQMMGSGTFSFVKEAPDGSAADGAKDKDPLEFEWKTSRGGMHSDEIAVRYKGRSWRAVEPPPMDGSDFSQSPGRLRKPASYIPEHRLERL